MAWLGVVFMVVPLVAVLVVGFWLLTTSHSGLGVAIIAITVFASVLGGGSAYLGRRSATRKARPS